MTDRIERTPSAFRLNLEQQKNRAKDLLRAAKAGEEDALARIVAAHASVSANTNGAALKLADAQFVIKLDLGREVWNALTSPDPRRLAAIARSGTPTLPIMAPALLRQLRELPDSGNGMSLTERSILQILAEEDSVTLSELIRTLLKRELLFFIGDAGVARVVREMERAVEPPVLRTIETPGERSFRNKLTLIPAGRDVLSGTRDWHSLRPPSRWVGGVHVQPNLSGWRWDEAKREAVWNGCHAGHPTTQAAYT